MKALRVLTGVHAGAEVRLTSGTYRIGGTQDADVCITDWRDDEVVIVLGEDGVTRMHSSNRDEVLVADFIAVPFGDIVLCLGPCDTAWPRDLDLLAGLLKTAEPVAQSVEVEAEPPQAPLRRMPWRTAAVALACTAAIGGLAAAGVMFASTQPSEAASVHFDPNALAQEVDKTLHRDGFADLYVTPQSDGVSVRGIVASADDSVKAQRIIDGLASGKASREYDVAQEDLDNIQQSLAGTGAAVSYSGHGVFRVSGNVPSMTNFRTLIAGVRADLDSNVKRVDVDVKERAVPLPTVDYTEVVATGGLRYIETPDGTKHFFESSNDRTNN
jgi:type III secretion protein D